MRQLGLPQNFL